MPQQFHNARRRAGGKREIADHDPADIDRVKSVHILCGINGEKNLFFIEMSRQRQLHENAVHRRVGVKACNQCKQLRFARIGGERMHIRANADLLACAVLVAHIDLRCGIVADNHHGKPGDLAGFLCKCGNRAADLTANRLRRLFSVYPNCHGYSFSAPSAEAVG